MNNTPQQPDRDKVQRLVLDIRNGRGNPAKALVEIEKEFNKAMAVIAQMKADKEDDDLEIKDMLTRMEDE